MVGKFEKITDVPSYMADYSKRLRPDSLLSLAQEMGMLAADEFGFGYDNLEVHHTVWVLSRLHFKFLKTPHWRDQIKLVTWHKGLDGLLFLRDFDFQSPEGESLIVGTSSWLVMDEIERRLVRPERLGDLIPTEGVTDNAIEEHCPKLMIPRGEAPELVGTHKVEYSDLDFLGHANNTKYIDWALDCMSETAVEKPLDEFYINFNQECRLGTTVELHRWNDPEGSIFIEGKAEGRQVFITKLIFLQNSI